MSVLLTWTIGDVRSIIDFFSAYAGQERLWPLCASGQSTAVRIFLTT